MDDKPFTNASPPRVIEAIDDVPELSKRSYFEEHFYGLRIIVAGKIISLYEGVSDARIGITNESDGAKICAAFPRPLAPELHLLHEGDRITVSGFVFLVESNELMLDDCRLDAHEAHNIASSQ